MPIKFFISQTSPAGEQDSARPRGMSCMKSIYRNETVSAYLKVTKTKKTMGSRKKSQVKRNKNRILFGFDTILTRIGFLSQFYIKFRLFVLRNKRSAHQHSMSRCVSETVVFQMRRIDAVCADRLCFASLPRRVPL